MKNRIIISLLISVGLITACSEYEIDKEMFIDAYKEVLTVRELVSDSAEANKAIESIYLKYEITEDLFKKEFFRYAETEEDFIEIIDSVRNRVMRELEVFEISRDSLKIDSEIADSMINIHNSLTGTNSVNASKLK